MRYLYIIATPSKENTERETVGENEFKDKGYAWIVLCSSFLCQVK